MATMIAASLCFVLAALPLPGADVNVTVYNDAGVPQRTINGAKTHLGDILGAAGLRLRWSETSSSQASLVMDVVPLSLASNTAERCGASRSIEAWIVAGPTVGPGKPSLGYALPLAKRGRNVVIFSRMVNAASAERGVDPGIILAHALAHEIGHVLLRSGKHSPHGLMSAAWSDREFEFMSRIPLQLTGREVDRIKKTLAGEGCTGQAADDPKRMQISPTSQ